MDIFRTLIVPVSQVDLARSIAAAFGPGGVGMWTTALSSDGLEPATRYISTGYIPEAFASLAPCQTWGIDESGAWQLVSSEPGDPVAVYQAALAASVPCTQADVDALFAVADVTAQEPFAAMERLTLAIINPPAEDF
jgi:hypothetical protein